MSPTDLRHEEEGRVGPIAGESPVDSVPNGGVTVLDDVLAALMNPKRRTLLYYLQEHETATVEELARQIVAVETDVPPDDVPSDALERATVELVHTHLPKLAEALFIEFEDRSLTVRYTEPSSLLDRTLTFIKDLDRAGE